MTKFFVILTLAVSLATAARPAAGAQNGKPSGPPPAPSLSAVEARTMLETYCVTCHNDRSKANFGNLSLQAVDLSNIAAHESELEKVLRKLQSAAMPPAGNKRPDAAAYAALSTWVASQLDRNATARPNAGRTESMHRLNRAEYQNAIRDLLSVEALQIEQMLPADDESYGFDNIAGVLGMSPTHLERYVVAARKISRIAVGDVTIAPYGETQMIPLDLGQDHQLEGLPPGTRGGVSVKRYFPVDGEYAIRFQTVSGFGRSMDEPNFVELTIDGERIYYDAVTQPKAAGNDDEASQNHEVKVPIKGGLRTIAITFLEVTAAQAEDYLQPYLRPPTVSVFKHARLGSDIGPYVSLLSFAGPLSTSGPGDTPSRRKIFVCTPAKSDETPCARRILTTLARRAYRRPVTAADVDVLMSFYKQGRAEGSFDKGVRVALQRILTSPDFLFRVERQPATARPGAPYRIADVELASRLSFFLWSSLPDETLLDLAATGRLHEPSVLAQQTKRMLADPRANALVENFAGQWLRLRNLQAVLRDTRMFPDFDENLRRDFRRETELFFRSIVQDDRSVLDFISGNDSFINERLARHYGVPGVYGSYFRRVTFTDGRRGGLLGQGSILTATAKPDRTSPVQRGKWILESLIGAPPPAPPPNVPALDETPVQGSLRQRMEMHRRNPVCASCHKMMDPLGFSLENYDAVGAWRTHEGSTAVDAEGAMPDGTSFDGAAGLRRALLAKPDIFVTALTEKLMVYALGRGMESYDQPAVRAIIRSAAGQRYRFSSIILGIVNSLPFQMRQADGIAVPAATAARR